MSDESNIDSQEQVLFSQQLVDWRVQDEVDEDLSELQKQPWTIMVKPGGHGLFIQAVAPDGTERHISIEVNNGNLHAYTGSSASDDQHTVIQIGLKGTVVKPMTPALQGSAADWGYLFGPRGVASHDGDIKPGCVEERGAPAP